MVELRASMHWRRLRPHLPNDASCVVAERPELTGLETRIPLKPGPHQNEIALISDLHLCSDPGCDEFTESDENLSAWLAKLASRYGSVLVAGDLYNLDHTRRIWDREGEIARTRARYARSSALLDGPEFIHVHGNHDLRLEAHGVPTTRLLHMGGRTILMTHGHQFDSPVKQLPWVSPSGSWAAAWFRRAQIDAAADLLVEVGKVANRMGGRKSQVPSGRTLPVDVAGARDLANASGADIVVMGHTHRAYVGEVADQTLYVNGGAICFGNYSWATIDLATLCARVHKGFELPQAL